MISSVISASSSCRYQVERLGRVMGYVAGWAFIAVAALITFDVLARRFLGVSTQATTELSGYTLAFGIGWGLAHALSMRAHVRIDVIVNRFPPGIRQWMHLLSLSCLGVLAGYLSFGAWTLVQESLLFDATDISALRTPLAFPQGLWAFGIVVFFVLIVLILVETALLAITGRTDEAEALLQSRSYEEEVAEALEAVGEAVATPTRAPSPGARS